MRTARKPKPYGFDYQAAVLEAGEVIGLKSGPMGVLRCLVKHCNGESGQAYPSKATLAGLGNAGLRTVKRHLRNLEQIGLIEPFAYQTGGHGRATVYTFGLPMWAKPIGPKNGAKLAWLEDFRGTYGANLASYRANLSRYSAKTAHQQEENSKKNRGDSDPAGRGEDGRRLNGVTFWELWEANGQDLATTRATWGEWEKEALRAAENEEGEKSKHERA